MNAEMLQQVLFAFGTAFFANHYCSDEIRKAFDSILLCRTATCGVREYECVECGNMVRIFNSCRNRNCPICQGSARADWAKKQESYVIPGIFYHHAVFTIPQELNALFLLNKALMGNLLFEAVKKALFELAEQKIGGQIGITATLHTWGQNLALHPHIHCIIPGGALMPNGTWLAQPKIMFPCRLLSERFKAIFINLIRNNLSQMLIPDGCPELLPCGRAAFLEALFKKKWHVYTKPTVDATHIILYLARYVNRVAISCSRILRVDDKRVYFTWRDYKDNNKNKNKTMSLTGDEFLRRLFMHVLPKGFRKTRHYGFLSPKGKSARIAHIKELATGVAATATATATATVSVSATAEVKPESEVATNEECSCKRCELCGGEMLLDNATFKPPLIIFSTLAREALARGPRTKEKVSADAEGKSTEEYAAV
jgi:hypothetical protein